MINLLALAAIALSLVLGSCTDPPEPPPAKPAAKPSAPPPDTLSRIGDEVTNLVNLWVEVLATVETESSAESASQRLEAIGDQFGALVERSENLPKLSVADYKRIDTVMDSQIGHAASGLEPQTARIFVLPDEIKSKIIPANEKLLRQFRAMSRSMLNTREKSPSKEPNE